MYVYEKIEEGFLGLVYWKFMSTFNWVAEEEVVANDIEMTLGKASGNSLSIIFAKRLRHAKI